MGAIAAIDLSPNPSPKRKGESELSAETQVKLVSYFSPFPPRATVYTQPYLERVSSHQKRIEIGLVRALK